MGLDMYAYVAAKAGQQSEFYETANFDEELKDYFSPTVNKPREIAYWRKHPNLHGWMEQLWHRKRNAQGNPVVENVNDFSGTFNGVELELTHEDLDELERAVTHKQLPSTSGFFFGNDADEHYYESDLQFIKTARADLFFGLKVFYNSSW
jgi:hypothetical protein